MSTHETPLFTDRRENQSSQSIDEVAPPSSTRDLSPKVVGILSRGEKRRQRQELVARFEEAFPTWMAYTPREMTLALTGLPAPVAKYQAQPGSQAFEILQSVIKDGQRFYEEAALSVQYLELAKVLETDEEPSARLIREDPQAKNALAEHLLAKSFKERATWNPKVKPRKLGQLTPRQKLKREIIDRIENGKTDEQLIADWRKAHDEGVGRRDFWSRQLAAIEDIEIVRGLDKEAQAGP